MSVNLRGVWSSMKFELQAMRKQASGAIVNCSSLGGLIGGDQRGTYHAAKHGVIGFTKSAALEYAMMFVLDSFARRCATEWRPKDKQTL
jgi:NAD(P)-dependent dehydrogenase (short-subunit alcohol dehydrogenase family)